ncbi:shikimate kinase, partial [bacterium]|nr:shikimate kinase [bacterium]
MEELFAPILQKMKGLILVGFMGTGKTVVGRELASRLKWDMLDTDDLIITRAGKSISRIFSEDGEPNFRTRETGVLEALMADNTVPRVIATGGGIVLAENNWSLLRALGQVICLSANSEVIQQRVGTAA